jgi:hypothetical protein
MAAFKKACSAMLMSPAMNDTDWFMDEVPLFGKMAISEAARKDTRFKQKLKQLFEVVGMRVVWGGRAPPSAAPISVVSHHHMLCVCVGPAPSNSLYIACDLIRTQWSMAVTVAIYQGGQQH